MKHLLLCFALVLPAVGQTLKPGDNIIITRDLRVVNGHEVDLTPLHRWYRNPSGERPLKAWLKITVIQVNNPGVSLDQCIVKTETGEPAEYTIKNLPPEVKRRMGKISLLQNDIAALKAQIASEQAIVRRQDAVTPTSVGGTRAYVESVATERQQVNLNAVALKEKQERLAIMEQILESHRNSENVVTTFALDTKQQFANLPMLDCGLQKR